MKLIFISDLHLSPTTPEHNQIFYQLLGKWERDNIDALYILGDFFDYWLGDDDENSFTREMSSKLSQFSQTTPIYFRAGNHDFALGKKYAKRSGMKLIKDMHVTHIAGNSILLSHGDTFCTLDTGYQKMKKFLQHPITIFVGRRLPLSWRRKLKEVLEHKSGVQTNSKPQHIYHVVDNTIIEYAHATNTDIVIHGHTHRPGSYIIEKQGSKPIYRYEIPDWQDHKPGGYIIVEDDKIHIHQVAD